MPGRGRPQSPTTNKMARHLGSIQWIEKTHLPTFAPPYIGKPSESVRTPMSTHSSLTSVSCKFRLSLLPCSEADYSLPRSVNATTRDFEPTVSNMTFARLVLAAATEDPLPESRSADLPPRQTAQSIVQYYMTNIYALFPLFSETVLLTALDDMYQSDRHVSSANKWLVYMVLAVGSMAQSRSNQDDHYRNGVDFVSHALQLADRALQPGYVTQIQSLAMLTQYAMLDPAHFDSWHLIGVTCRAAVDLGFHQDPPNQSLADRMTLDMRRKTFYCVYALDRFVEYCMA